MHIYIFIFYKYMLILYVVIHVLSPQQIISSDSVFPEGTVRVFLKIKPASDPAAFLLAVLRSFTLLPSVSLPLPEQLHCPLHPPHHPSYTTPSFPVFLPNTCRKFLFLTCPRSHMLTLPTGLGRSFHLTTPPNLCRQLGSCSLPAF